MKTTLTKDDPKGFYECQYEETGRHAVRKWNGSNLTFPDGIKVLDKYTNFLRLYTEADVEAINEELRKEREAGERLAAVLLESSAEISRIKASPYPMRKADKPDCVGLWINNIRHSVIVTDAILRTAWVHPPYYYLGPIPVIPAEQKPPQVVTIRCKATGKESLAIPQMRDGTPEYFFLILADGTVSGERVWCNNWEVVK